LDQAKKNIFEELFREGIAYRIVKDLKITNLFSLAFGPRIFLTRDHLLGLAPLDEDAVSKCLEACWDSIKR